MKATTEAEDPYNFYANEFFVIADCTCKEKRTVAEYCQADLN